MEDNYDDIIQLPHHVSSVHPHMSIHDRAAQFAPFAALTGHGAAIAETAWLTDEKLELDESQKMVLDQKLLNIMHNADKKCVSIEYFVKDDRKAGGRYEHVSGYIRNVDVYGKKIVMEDRTEIPIDDIYDLNIDQNGDVYLHE